MTQKRFQAIPGTHSATLKNHLYGIRLRKGKLSRNRLRKKLRIEAARIIGRQSGFSKAMERKVAAAELQIIRMEKASQQLKKYSHLNHRLARQLIIRALKQLEEINQSYLAKGIEKKHIDQELLPSFQHLGNKKNAINFSSEPVKNFPITLELIGRINECYSGNVIGVKEGSLFDKLVKYRRFAAKLAKRRKSN